jgi:transposase
MVDPMFGLTALTGRTATRAALRKQRPRIVGPSFRQVTCHPRKEKEDGMTIVDSSRPVTGGVDTHMDTHTAAVIDHLGGQLGVETFRADADGYVELVGWVASFGPIDRVGVEGTGSYGAGLARHLMGQGVDVVEVDRPNRQVRHRLGKSDPTDAMAAARAALSGQAVGRAKTGDGPVEAMRVLLVAKRSSRGHRIDLINQIRHLVVTASEPTRERLRDCSTIMIIKTSAAMRPRATGNIAADTCNQTIVELGRRARDLTDYNKAINGRLEGLVDSVAPDLLARPGIGADTAAILLVAAGDNPNRIRSEAAWANLCGVAPRPASSGKTTRHRLSRSGNRQANHALWRICLWRMGAHDDTLAYVERRLTEGKTKREIMRCLKRYIAREVYQLLPTDLT